MTLAAEPPGLPSTNTLRSSGLHSGIRREVATTAQTSSGLAFISTVAEIGVGALEVCVRCSCCVGRSDCGRAASSRSAA